MDERECIEEWVTLPLPLPTRPLLRGTNDSSITPSLVLGTFIAVCGSFSFGCAVGYSSAAESGIMEDLGLSVAAYSVFGSIVTIGGMIGAISSGKIADMIGRRRTMFLSGMFCIPGWLAIAFAKDAWWLDFGRLSIGIGIGHTSYVVPVYIAEITPKNLRGRFTTTHQMMKKFGFALSFIFGNIISWRTLSLIGAIPCLLQLIGLFFVLESPRWLAKHGREKEFEAALQHLRGKNTDISQEANDIRDVIETFQDNNSEGKALDLFQRRYAYSIIVGVGLMLLQQLGGDSGMGFYATTVYAEAGFSTIIGTTTLAIIMLPEAIVSLLVMDIFGRRTLLMVSSAGSGFFLSLIGLSFYLKEQGYLKELTPIMAFIGFVGHRSAYGIGLSGIPWVIMSEIFPVSVKVSAGSLVTVTYWSCSWFITFTFNFMLEWSKSGTFLIFAGVCGLTFLFVWKLVPETKGRTLEEIQEKITHHSPQ